MLTDIFPNIFQNLDTLVVGVAIAAIGILGFVIFMNNRKSITARSFLLFSIITVFWSIFNYAYYKVENTGIAFWLLRFVIFFAVWHAFSFFQLSYVFPGSVSNLPKRYWTALVPIITITSILTLTPFVFSRVTEVLNGRITQLENGPGIALFTFVIISLVASSIYLLIQKTRRALPTERVAFFQMLVGLSITFALLLAFNFILPAFFSQSRFIPFGPVFLLPFALFTFYAIVRHGLLSMKVIATDVLIFLLVVGTLTEVITARSPFEIVLRIIVFALLLIVGILLIRSVRGEVDQRERLQILSEELQNANEELRKLDEQKSDFITIASHQLRTPLTIIKGYISMIIEKSFGAVPSDLDEPLKRIGLSNDRLINLVNDLLDLSRIERGKMTYVFEKASVLAVVEDVFKELQEAAKQKKLEFTLTKPDTAPESNIDPKKIKEVLINIVDNAIHYTAQGFVRMAAEYDSARKVLRVSVQDSGIGLTPDEIQHLFVKFSRMDNAKRVSSEGTGLGLYVAKLIVEDHKGKIWVESKGHNTGSTFIFEIPTLE